MEKFAVDLDKVLDDFELQEDQAELLTSKSLGQCDGSETKEAFTEHVNKAKVSDGLNSISSISEEQCTTTPGIFKVSEVTEEEEANGEQQINEDLTPVFTRNLLEDREVPLPQSEVLLFTDEINDIHSSPSDDLLIDISEQSSLSELRENDADIKQYGQLILQPNVITENDKENSPSDHTDGPLNSDLMLPLLDQVTDDELKTYLDELEKEDFQWEISEVPENISINGVKDEVLVKHLEETTEEDEEQPVVEPLHQEDTSLVHAKNTVEQEETFDVETVLKDVQCVAESATHQEIECIVSSQTTTEFMETTSTVVDVVDPTAPVNVPPPSVLDGVEAINVESSGSLDSDPYGDDSTASLESEPVEPYPEDSTTPADSEPPCSSPETVSETAKEEETLPTAPNENSEETPSAAAILPEPYSNLTDEERMLGLLKPIWIPDEEASQCMNCTQRFTVLRRRHHCRACGRVLCAACCSSRARLEYMEGREVRVCLPCLQILKKVEAYKKWGGVDDIPQATGTSMAGNESGSSSPSSSGSTPASSPSAHAPTPMRVAVRVNPNNPAEYCSTIPPHLQAAAAAALPPPSVLVPVGVLKKEGSSSQSRSRNEPKQVIFSDGIRPGGDLASELDSWRVATAVEPAGASSSGSSHRISHRKQAKAAPPVVVPCAVESAPISRPFKSICQHLPAVLDDIDSVESLTRALADPSAPPVTFACQSSQQHSQHVLKIAVKLLQLDCCVRRKCWSFVTEGMRWASQDEIIILLEQLSGVSEDNTETLPPADIFAHLLSIYEEALIKHHVIVNLGHTVTPGTFLDSSEHGGFLFFRTSFQCVQNITLPAPPYLIGVLLQRWEIPWAKVFPLRLLLRLGAEFRYYPAPLFSVRNRKPLFGEIGHTIVNLLADMRNFNYSLPAVPGLVVHMEDGKRETNILLPRSRYQQVCKALAQSNDNVLSLAASFSPAADAHLVCLQLDDGSYQTQAINIHTKPRKVTGASFVVFNGALKSSSGLTGRSSIVEDGVMVQLLPDMLEALKQSMIRMENYVILCGKMAEQPEETVTLKWVDQEPSPVNTGVISPIDGRNLSGVSSIRVMQHRDYKGEGHRQLRWSELFILQTDETASGRSSSSTKSEDSSDVTRLAETIAKAASMALATKLAALTPHTLVGLRVSLDGDSVEYQSGANQKPLASCCTEELDSSLIPLLHRESSTQSLPCVIELWFRILHP